MATQHHQVIILGAGFGGLGMALRLLHDDERDFVILEKAERLGGTWRDNVYPGAGCDVPSHLYSWSFEQKPDWSRVFSGQAEILAYMDDVAERRGLRRFIRFGQEITEARWDEAAALWRVRTATGEEHAAPVFVAAWGQLNRPAYPAIPGQQDFAGPSFHSARWRHDVSLAGLRVASIGNGASAVQFIPEVAREAAQLTIFQRSANWIVPKLDRAYAAEELAAYRADLAALQGDRDAVYAERETRFHRMRLGSEKAAELTQIALDHLAAQVPDAALRATLTPDYPIGCKRILISDEFYPTLTQPQVGIVTDRIERIERDAILTDDGRRHPVDAIVYATGFETHSFLGAGDVVGREGRSLRAAWGHAPEAYFGLAVSGFPNFFVLYGPNTNLGHNSIILMLEAQSDYVMQALHRLRAGARSIEVRAEAMARFNADLQAEMQGTAWTGSCSSWYKSADGRVLNNWSNTVEEYRRRIARLDAADFALA